MPPVPCPADRTTREPRERVPTIWMSQARQPCRSAPQTPLLDPPGSRFPAGHRGQDAPTSEVRPVSACTLRPIFLQAQSPRAEADGKGGRGEMFELHVGLCSQVSSNFRNVGGLGSECKQGFSQNP